MLKYAGIWWTKYKPNPSREVQSLEQPLSQTVEVSISFIMRTEKSMLDGTWVIVATHTCMHREAWKEEIQTY